ncbi:MAG: phosphoglycerate mutase family protein [Parcubacteria group bacterium]
MTMPIDLVIVRHGESEGNVANRLSRRGDDRHFTLEFLARPSADWRLTLKGIEQAKRAGQWIRENIGQSFDRYYCSEYIRAAETAYYLGLPGAVWFMSQLLRERDWGELESMTDRERKERFVEELKRRERDFYGWAPPSGESIATVCGRVGRVIDTIYRECDGQRVIIVSHGETSWALRVNLERWNQRQFAQIYNSADGRHKLLWNCSILHYTRLNEQGVGEKYLCRVRSVWPEDPETTDTGFVRIVRQRYSNDDLHSYVEEVPRLIAE